MDRPDTRQRRLPLRPIGGPLWAGDLGCDPDCGGGSARVAAAGGWRRVGSCTRGPSVSRDLSVIFLFYGKPKCAWVFFPGARAGGFSMRAP